MVIEPTTPAFTLAPRHDLEQLRARFAERGRVEIPVLLPPSQTQQLRKHLVGRADWQLVMNAGEKVFEIPRADHTAMLPTQRQGLDQRIAAAARHGFQYRYESIRISDAPEERAERPSLLTDFVDFLGSPATTALLGAVTGLVDIGFVDGQATAYGPGHFLTCHDDDVVGKQRLAAYVFGLAPDWRAEWGGLLMFHGDDGNISDAFTPAMGALRLFSVPVPHSVSYVTPFAPEPRLSVTGWLRRSR